jgi:hypothetical protein
MEHATSMTIANELAIRRALEEAGVEFLDANGGGPGVRLRKVQDDEKSATPKKKITPKKTGRRSP